MLIDLATHGLIATPLNKDSTVVDLGAHRGDFASEIQARFGCRVIAVEPSAHFCDLLRRISGITTVHAAISAQDGFSDFYISPNPQASSIRACGAINAVCRERVETMTLTTLMSTLGIQKIDVLKIDIEGSEVELFQALDDSLIASIPQISVELHDFNGMITSEQAIEIESRLSGLGFCRIQLSRTNRENVLFYRPRACGIGIIAQIVARLITRNLIGFKRWRKRHRSLHKNLKQ